eukprot:227808_1
MITADMLFIRITAFWVILSFCRSQSCVVTSLLPRNIYAHQTAYDALSHCTYLFGGILGPTTPSTTIYKRNMDQTDWITLAVSTPTAWFYSYSKNSIVINRTVYFIGITDRSWTGSPSGYQSGKIYKFDIETEQWMANNQLVSPPHPSVDGCLTGNDVQLFMIGGKSCDDCVDEYLQIYNINDNSWSDEPVNISPIQGNGWSTQYCHIVDNELYVFGGLVGNSVTGNARTDGIFKYNSLNKWSVLPLILPTPAMYGTTLYKDPCIYLVGGKDNANSLNTIIEFDTNTESITNLYIMQESLQMMDAEIVNDKVYIFGGKDGGTLSKNTEQCDMLKPTPSTPPSQQPSRQPSAIPSKDPSRNPNKAIAHPPTDQTARPSMRPSANPSRRGGEGEASEESPQSSISPPELNVKPNTDLLDNVLLAMG